MALNVTPSSHQPAGPLPISKVTFDSHFESHTKCLWREASASRQLCHHQQIIQCILLGKIPVTQAQATKDNASHAHQDAAHSDRCIPPTAAAAWRTRSQ